MQLQQEAESTSSIEVMKDSTATNVPGTYGWGTLSVSDGQGPFGVQTTMRKIDRYPPDASLGEGYYSAWRFGRYNEFYWAMRISTSAGQPESPWARE